MINRIIGLLLLVLLYPFFLFISIIIYIDDGFPILFRQKRIGRNNSKFTIYKFRTMKNGIPEIPTHLVKDPQQYYSRSGPFLRKFSIDELPQLINIIKGEMIFVGPRPALHNQDNLVELRTRVGVHELMPGVTGWAQVNGRDELSIEKKVQYDLYYLKNKSIRLDIKILIITVIKIIKKEGVNH
jgi:O-antigen biosynthesis protein WbqP